MLDLAWCLSFLTALFDYFPRIGNYHSFLFWFDLALLQLSRPQHHLGVHAAHPLGSPSRLLIHGGPVLYSGRVVLGRHQDANRGYRSRTGFYSCNNPQKLLLLSFLLNQQPSLHVLNSLFRNTGRMVLYQFIYTIALSIATTTLVTPTISSSKQLTFLLTLLIYALSSDPPTCSPLMSRGTFVCTTVLAWTAALIWILPLC